MTACSDEETGGGSGSGNGQINYEEGYKYLSSLNVSNAKMIYQKTSGTSVKSRAAGDEDGTYYKLDLNGNESKLAIKDSTGQYQDIRIDYLVKLSDRVLVMTPNTADVESVAGINNDMGSSSSTYIGVYTSLVDVETEKIYRWPNELKDFNLPTTKSMIDGNGNVYFPSCYDLNYPQYDQIYKLNITDFTIQKILQDGVTCNGFEVTDDGFIIYWNENQYRVKCPGGSIVPITGIGFYFDNNIYSIENNSIYVWRVVDNNHLEKTEVCIFETDWGEGPILTNYVRNSVVFRYSGYNNAAEFDGNKITEVSLPDDFHNISNMGYQDFYVTNKAWYITGNAELHKLDMNTYQDYKIPVLDYELQTISASPESPNITFTGFRYSDGANVVGTIDENDKITIDNVADNGEQIINLIPLN